MADNQEQKTAVNKQQALVVEHLAQKDDFRKSLNESYKERSELLKAIVSAAMTGVEDQNQIQGLITKTVDDVLPSGENSIRRLVVDTRKISEVSTIQRQSRVAVGKVLTASEEKDLAVEKIQQLFETHDGRQVKTAEIKETYLTNERGINSVKREITETEDTPNGPTTKENVEETLDQSNSEDFGRVAQCLASRDDSKFVKDVIIIESSLKNNNYKNVIRKEIIVTDYKEKRSELTMSEVFYVQSSLPENEYFWRVVKISITNDGLKHFFFLTCTEVVNDVNNKEKTIKSELVIGNRVTDTSMIKYRQHSIPYTADNWAQDKDDKFMELVAILEGRGVVVVPPISNIETENRRLSTSSEELKRAATTTDVSQSKAVKSSETSKHHFPKSLGLRTASSTNISESHAVYLPERPPLPPVTTKLKRKATTIDVNLSQATKVSPSPPETTELKRTATIADVSQSQAILAPAPPVKIIETAPKAPGKKEKIIELLDVKTTLEETTLDKLMQKDSSDSDEERIKEQKTAAISISSKSTKSSQAKKVTPKLGSPVTRSQKNVKAKTSVDSKITSETASPISSSKQEVEKATAAKTSDKATTVKSGDKKQLTPKKEPRFEEVNDIIQQVEETEIVKTRTPPKQTVRKSTKDKSFVKLEGETKSETLKKHDKTISVAKVDTKQKKTPTPQGAMSFSVVTTSEKKTPKKKVTKLTRSLSKTSLSSDLSSLSSSPKSEGSVGKQEPEQVVKVDTKQKKTPQSVVSYNVVKTSEKKAPKQTVSKLGSISSQVSLSSDLSDLSSSQKSEGSVEKQEPKKFAQPKTIIDTTIVSRKKKGATIIIGRKKDTDTTKSTTQKPKQKIPTKTSNGTKDDKATFSKAFENKAKSRNGNKKQSANRKSKDKSDGIQKQNDDTKQEKLPDSNKK